jgi:hypothetical protein
VNATASPDDERAVPWWRRSRTLAHRRSCSLPRSVRTPATAP